MHERIIDDLQAELFLRSAHASVSATETEALGPWLQPEPALFSVEAHGSQVAQETAAVTGMSVRSDGDALGPEKAARFVAVDHASHRTRV